MVDLRGLLARVRRPADGLVVGVSHDPDELCLDEAKALIDEHKPKRVGLEIFPGFEELNFYPRLFYKLARYAINQGITVIALDDYDHYIDSMAACQLEHILKEGISDSDIRNDIASLRRRASSSVYDPVEVTNCHRLLREVECLERALVLKQIYDSDMLVRAYFEGVQESRELVMADRVLQYRPTLNFVGAAHGEPLAQLTRQRYVRATSIPDGVVVEPFERLYFTEEMGRGI